MHHHHTTRDALDVALDFSDDLTRDRAARTESLLSWIAALLAALVVGLLVVGAALAPGWSADPVDVSTSVVDYGTREGLR